MHLNYKLALALVLVAGCCSSHLPVPIEPMKPDAKQLDAELHELKIRAQHLKLGMTRDQVKEILKPMPTPLLDTNISGLIASAYVLEPGISVSMLFASDDTLVRLPDSFYVYPPSRMKSNVRHSNRNSRPVGSSTTNFFENPFDQNGLEEVGHPVSFSEIK